MVPFCNYSFTSGDIKSASWCLGKLWRPLKRSSKKTYLVAWEIVGPMLGFSKRPCILADFPSGEKDEKSPFFERGPLFDWYLEGIEYPVDWYLVKVSPRCLLWNWGLLLRRENGFPVVCAKFFVIPLDFSACSEANEGKSSPNSHGFALGRGSSARFILDQFMAATTHCRLKIDSWALAEPKRQSLLQSYFNFLIS